MSTKLTTAQRETLERVAGQNGRAYLPMNANTASLRRRMLLDYGGGSSLRGRLTPHVITEAGRAALQDGKPSS